MLASNAAGGAVERRQMKIAGLGFRPSVRLDSLREALSAAGGAEGLSALATVHDKASTLALVALARDLGLPIRAVPADALACVGTWTQSEHVKARFGVGSVAEAAALVAAGRHARLLSTRVISRDRTATAAIAEGEGE
jgi:cobalt-precorrin 5A hydrolase